MARGLAVAGEYPAESIIAAAKLAESTGFSSFWLSQPPGGHSLATLTEVASVATLIPLGVGAIPLTASPPASIIESINALDLPLGRLYLGVGSGIGRGALDRVRDGVAHLRSLGAAEIVVAPLGPKMCQVAGEVADGVLLNWLTPEHARQSIEWIRRGADEAGRPCPTVRAYVRCALTPAALPRLRAECDRYGAFPHYAAHFDRQGVPPLDTTITGASASEFQGRLQEYEDVLDEVIVRVITPNDGPNEVRDLIEVARSREGSQ
jgi:alkanesulfonate monooxygenase SsuD/methylene tetrahydromethanopterin reductase-like flavin-dependent oxidoreductase (luciferase family)